MVDYTSRKKRHRRIELLFQVPNELPTPVRVPLEVDPHTLVMMAWGKFLPAGVLPSKLLRKGKQVAFYDPMAMLSAAGAQDGDVLICEHDTDQAITEPSLLGAYRAMRTYAENARQKVLAHSNN